VDNQRGFAGDIGDLAHDRSNKKGILSLTAVMAVNDRPSCNSAGSSSTAIMLSPWCDGRERRPQRQPRDPAPIRHSGDVLGGRLLLQIGSSAAAMDEGFAVVDLEPLLPELVLAEVFLEAVRVLALVGMVVVPPTNGRSAGAAPAFLVSRQPRLVRGRLPLFAAIASRCRVFDAAACPLSRANFHISNEEASMSDRIIALDLTPHRIERGDEGLFRKMWRSSA
jgi:hypothetical protein